VQYRSERSIFAEGVWFGLVIGVLLGLLVFAVLTGAEGCRVEMPKITNAVQVIPATPLPPLNIAWNSTGPAPINGGGVIGPFFGISNSNLFGTLVILLDPSPHLAMIVCPNVNNLVPGAITNKFDIYHGPDVVADSSPFANLNCYGTQVGENVYTINIPVDGTFGLYAFNLKTLSWITLNATLSNYAGAYTPIATVIGVNTSGVGFAALTNRQYATPISGDGTINQNTVTIATFNAVSGALLNQAEVFEPDSPNPSAVTLITDWGQVGTLPGLANGFDASGNLITATVEATLDGLNERVRVLTWLASGSSATPAFTIGTKTTSVSDVTPFGLNIITGIETFSGLNYFNMNTGVLFMGEAPPIVDTPFGISSTQIQPLLSGLGESIVLGQSSLLPLGAGSEQVVSATFELTDNNQFTVFDSAIVSDLDEECATYQTISPNGRFLNIITQTNNTLPSYSIAFSRVLLSWLGLPGVGVSAAGRVNLPCPNNCNLVNQMLKFATAKGHLSYARNTDFTTIDSNAPNSEPAGS
jgi:hypothetical protein